MAQVASTLNPIEDLGKISAGRKKQYVIPLPTTCKSVVVSYNKSDDGPAIKVSCVIPPAKRTVRVSTGMWCRDEIQDEIEENYWEEGLKNLLEEAYTTLEIDCPSLLLRTSYSDIPSYGYVRRLVAGHAIFCINDEVTDHISAAPYIISNVYANGEICFGDNNVPDSPRKAFNIFWNSPFNDELYGEAGSQGSGSTESFIKTYHDEVLSKAPWEDLTDEICGKKFWASPRGAGGLLISDNKDLLKNIPQKFWRESPTGLPFTIALAEEKDGFWQFTSGNFKFSLDSNCVRISETNNKRAAAVRKKLM